MTYKKGKEKEVTYWMCLLDIMHSSKIEHVKETWSLPYGFCWYRPYTVLKTVATNNYPLFVVGKVPWFCLTVG